MALRKEQLFEGGIILSGGLYLSSLYGIFRSVFWNSDSRKRRDVPLPKGPHYDEEASRMADLVKLMRDIPFEEVWVTAEDGTRLFGRYYEVKKGAPLQIQFHGYRGSALRDMAGGNRVARENGINTLLVDMRAHGRSGGHVTTFGIRERKDCQTWAEYAFRRFGRDVPVVLSGVSMGAAAVLMASDLDLPENVKGIIADCPYSSPKEIICRVMRDRGYPEKLLWQLVWQAAALLGHFDLNSASAMQSVKRTKLPILLIHGDEDLFVPVEMSRELARAGKTIRLEIFPGGAHGISYLTDVERYWKLEEEFMNRIIHGAEKIPKIRRKD